MFGITEQKRQDKEERIKADTEEIIDLLSTCGVRSPANGKVKKVIRLGKISLEYDSEVQKDRPVLITLDSLETEKTIFRNITNLNGKKNKSSIHIRNDLTRHEREREIKLREEAR